MYLYGYPPWLFTQVTNHQVGDIATPRSYLKTQKRCVGKTGPADLKPHASETKEPPLSQRIPTVALPKQGDQIEPSVIHASYTS